MKKEIIVAITTTLLAVSAYSQSYEKWNDFYKRTEYFDENGMDISDMSEDEIEEASEVFALPSGRYLIVEGQFDSEMRFLASRGPWLVLDLLFIWAFCRADSMASKMI